MNIYQIVYNSSAVTLKGSSGLGVRTASEGTPQAYIDLVDKTGTLRSYNSGKLTIPSNVIFESPEKIHELPIGYYYRTMQVNEKTIYLLGRVVSVCFDFQYYITSKATRSGNFVAHVLVSEEYPGKEAFNLLFEKAQAGKLHFIPRDYTPVVSNAELQTLMVDKAQPLPATTAAFPEIPTQWSEKALNLFFAYRAALQDVKPIAVSLPHAISATTIAEFMGLLPEKIAQETTFVTNHQTEGYAKDVKITFTNEYYQYTISSNLCTCIDLINENRYVDNIEKTWRPILQKALQENDLSKVRLIIDWIFSPIAADNMGASAELNEALFNYSQLPELFTLQTVDEVDNILESLSKYASQGTLSVQRLNDLIIQNAEAATDLQGYAQAIDYCEKASMAGLDVSAATKHIQQKFTKYVVDGIRLYDALALLHEATLRKYTLTEKYRKLSDILPDVLAAHQGGDEGQIKTFAYYLESDAAKRVGIYKQLLLKKPEAVYIKQYIKLLNADKAEADKIDYIAEFKDFHSNGVFAQLFYEQVQREVGIGSKKISKTIFDLAETNNLFKALVSDDTVIFHTLYNTAQQQLNPETYESTSKTIKTYVLPLLAPESPMYKQWQLLDDVINVNVPATRNEREAFYALAKQAKHMKALKAIAPLCLEYMKGTALEEFLCVVRERMLMTDKEIIDLIFTNETIRRSAEAYIICLAQVYEFEYEQIYDLLYRCYKGDEKDVKQDKKKDEKETQDDNEDKKEATKEVIQDEQNDDNDKKKKKGDKDKKKGSKKSSKKAKKHSEADKEKEDEKLTRKAVLKIIKEHFPELYRQHNKASFWAKIKSIFTFKKKD